MMFQMVLPQEGPLPPGVHYSHDPARSSLHRHTNENEDGGENERPTTTDLIR